MNRYEKFTEFLECAITSHTEYETEHEDAGDAYAHMPREGGFDYSEGEKRLVEFLDRTGVDRTGVDLDSIVEFALDNFEMTPGHIFSSSESDAEFLVDSYPVGEVEMPIELSCLEDEFGIFARGLWLKALGDNQFCLRGDMTGGYPCGYSYESTDATWRAVISKESLEEFIGDAQKETLDEATKEMRDLFVEIVDNYDTDPKCNDPACDAEGAICDHDDKDYFCVTVGAESIAGIAEGNFGWQTGDNSYTGGAYSFPHWGVVHIGEGASWEECKTLASEVLDQIAELAS